MTDPRMTHLDCFCPTRGAAEATASKYRDEFDVQIYDPPWHDENFSGWLVCVRKRPPTNGGEQ